LKRKEKKKENEIGRLNNIFIHLLLLFAEDGDHEGHKKLWFAVA